MANIMIHQTILNGRTYMWIEVTPKSKQTRAQLQAFKKGVKAFEKKWKATAKAAKAAGKKY